MKYSSFYYWHTSKLKELIFSPDQRTFAGTDYGHKIGKDIVNEASATLWERLLKNTERELNRLEQAMEEWDNYLDASGVPPIPEEYWGTLYLKHLSA